MVRHHIQHPGLRRHARMQALQRTLIERNPIGNAIAMREGQARIDEYQRNVALNLYLQPAGEDATALLSRLGWLIGLATEAERIAVGLTPRMRMLHGGLRHIQQICLNGYVWPEGSRAGLDAQLQTAVQVLKDHPQHVLAMIEGANVFEAQIRNHQVTPESVAGAEVYQQEGH